MCPGFKLRIGPVVLKERILFHFKSFLKSIKEFVTVIREKKDSFSMTLLLRLPHILIHLAFEVYKRYCKLSIAVLDQSAKGNVLKRLSQAR